MFCLNRPFISINTSIGRNTLIRNFVRYKFRKHCMSLVVFTKQTFMQLDSYINLPGPSFSQAVTSMKINSSPEKTVIQKNTRTPMFTAALFTIARSWKQPKCSLTDEWIKKMWYIYTVEYYSAIKRNKIGSFVEMWMDLETVIQNEVSQKEKNKYHILMHICGI